jgi:hypothetical protein
MVSWILIGCLYTCHVSYKDCFEKYYTYILHTKFNSEKCWKLTWHYGTRPNLETGRTCNTWFSSYFSVCIVMNPLKPSGTYVYTLCNKNQTFTIFWVQNQKWCKYSWHHNSNHSWSQYVDFISLPVITLMCVRCLLNNTPIYVFIWRKTWISINDFSEWQLLVQKVNVDVKVTFASSNPYVGSVF